MRLPGSSSFTRSISRNGKRCGRCAMTSLTSISLMLFSLAAQPRRAASPRVVLVHRPDARVGAWLQDRARDESSGGNVDVIDDVQMAEDQRRAAKGAMAPDVGAAGDTDAAGHRGMRADARVVADLDLIVELHALLDDGVVERTAVDRGVGTDLDIVADAHRADLRDLDPAPVVVGDAKAVGADHRPRMDDHPLAERAPRVDHDARIEAAIFADLDLVAYHAAGADRDARAQLCAFRHHGRGMHARRLRAHRIEDLRHAREVEIGIVGHDTRPRRIAFRFGTADYRPGTRRVELRAVALAGEEADLARARRLERSHLVDEGIGGARHAAAEAGDGLCERHPSRPCGPRA